MRNNFIAFFSILFFSIAGAQTVGLSWKGSKVVDFGTEKKNYPAFTNDGYSAEGENVVIHIKKKSDGQLFTAKNLRWEKVAWQELYDLKPGALPENVSAESVRYRIPGGETVSEVIIPALKRDDKYNVYRLSSFEVVAAANTDRRNLSAKSATMGTPENPLASGTFYRIKVDRSGIFKITAQFLKDNGINPSSINPKNFRIYGNGGNMLPENNRDNRFGALQEDAIQVVGEEDGVWNDGDYALFYAQGADGFHLYNSSGGNGKYRAETRSDAALHLKNIYEDYAYYFINFDKGPGKRVQEVDPGIPSQLMSRYDAYQFIDDDKQNLMKIGRTWVADAISGSKTVTFTTDTPVLASDTIIYRSQVAAYRSQGNSVQFDLNGLNTATRTVEAEDNDYRLLRFSGISTGLSGSQISFNIKPNPSANPVGTVFFDYAELQYRQDLVFNGKQMGFRDYKIYEGGGKLYGFSIQNSTSLEQVWDVSDVTNATRKVNKSGNGALFNFGYKADSDIFNNEFVAFNNATAFSPTFVGRVSNQDLHSMQNVDYLILSNAALIGQAQRLADYHAKADGWNVKLVDVADIYNEFSSGSQDLTGIRDFVTMLNTPAGKLKYVFILGDGSYDFKNKTSGNTNIVPAYESEESGNFVSSFVTDDYIVMTDSLASPRIINNLPDLPVGRLTADNATEARQMLDKTLAYYNALPRQSTPFGDWRFNLDFVTDDDLDDSNASGGTPFHVSTEKYLVQNFEGTTDKPEYHVKKLYLDSFSQTSTAGGLRYPAVNQAIVSDINNSLFLMYFGHGGINGWAQERVLSSTEVDGFNNFNNIYSRFPLVSTITCEFALWDDPATNSVGEQVSKRTTGGAATMITSSRAIDIGYGVSFSGTLINNLFKLYNDDFLPIADAHLAAKKLTGANSNHLKVNFLGDPAMKLARPRRLAVVDDVQSPMAGQLRALDFVTVKGHINKADGSTDKNFNGNIQLEIFDKRVSKTTLNNDGNLGKMPYMEEGSPIVKTSGKAVNGEFSVQFYVPKDINYTVGTGRMLVYADNNVYDVFTDRPQKIGEINPDGLKDNTPPKVSLYMNNTNFADGGITNQNPTLLACITDDTGINSTGAGIGHDITAILDGQVINTIVLNDFFSSGVSGGCAAGNLADYQKGAVAYPFSNLSPGQHTLTFKVWDINNNSTTMSLNFTVKDDASQNLSINRLLNWPNPFTDKTYIQFEHNCDDILNVNVQIYTITGKLVRTLSVPVTAEPFLQGYRTPRQAIEWDGRDDFGDTVGKGTYIFKIFARSSNQEKCKGSATAIEKMVLLK